MKEEIKDHQGASLSGVFKNSNDSRGGPWQPKPKVEESSVIRLPRPPQKNVSSTGVDTVTAKTLPRFLLTRWRAELKWQGSVQTARSMRHYTNLLHEVLDGRTLRKLEALASSVGESSPLEKEEVFKELVEPFLKELEATASQEDKTENE